MKAISIIAAALTLSTSLALAAEKAPVQMSAAEMDQVVAGASQARLRDGSSGGVPQQLRQQLKTGDGTGTGAGTGVCTQQ